MGDCLKTKIAHAKLVGKSHLISGTPCQDFIFVKKNRKLCVDSVALSDGAGSCSLSHVGAEIITKTACLTLSSNFEKIYNSNQSDAAKVMIPVIIKAISKEAFKNGTNVKQYSGTLLAVARKNDRFIAVHIGDGVIGCVRNGVTSIISLPENGEHCNTTYFVTDETAEQKIRFYNGSVERGDIFFLMSDGTAESLYDKKNSNLASACITMAKWMTELPVKKITPILLANIEQNFTRKSHDDCSLALAFCG